MGREQKNFRIFFRITLIVFQVDLSTGIISILWLKILG